MRWDPTKIVRIATGGAALGGTAVYAWAACIDAGVLSDTRLITTAVCAGMAVLALLERRLAASLACAVGQPAGDSVRALSGIPTVATVLLATAFLAHLFGSSWFVRSSDGDGDSVRLIALCCAVALVYLLLVAFIHSRRALDWAIRCGGGGRRIAITHALLVIGVVEVAALAVPADGVFGPDQRYELPIEAPAHIRLHGGARYRWVSLIGDRDARPFRTGSVIVDDTASVEVMTGTNAVTLSLYVGVVPNDYDLRPYTVPPVLATASNRGDASARVSVGRTGAPGENSFDVAVGTTAQRIDVQLPASTAAAPTTITATAPEGTRVLLHGIHSCAGERRPRRVVMISLDTHGARHMSVDRRQAIDTNPALRRLVTEDPRALYFSNAVATSFWTLPTHASVFTGLYPSQHRMTLSSPARMPGDEVEWLTETVRNADVRTFHLFSHMRLADRYGYHRGTDFYRAYEGKDLPFGRRARRVFGDAVELLDESRRDDVFMFLHLFDAHAPYENFPHGHDRIAQGAAAHYPQTLYEGAEYKALKASIGSDPKARLAAVSKYAPTYAPHMPGARAAYQLGLRDVDDAIGAFVDRLKERGLYEDTTLIFFGDHGEEFFTHGLLTHSTLYQENLNVPFAIKLAAGAPVEIRSPSLNGYQFEAHTTAHRIVHDLFSLEYPPYLSTAASSALGLDELVSLDGHRSAFAEHYAYDSTDRFYEAAYLAPDRTKTLLSTQLGPGGSWQLHEEFLQVYDLSTDHDELVNLADRAADAGVRRDRLLERADAVRALRFENARSSEIPAPELERLRALGYF